MKFLTNINMEENKQAQQQGNDAGKVGKQYEENKKLLLAILGDGGKALLKKSKATDDQIDKAVENLLKKKDEDFAKSLEADIAKLVEIHLMAEDEIAKKEKELEQAKQASKKKFNEEANKIFQRVADHKALHERHKRVLGSVAETTSDSETTNDKDGPNYPDGQEETSA